MIRDSSPPDAPRASGSAGASGVRRAAGTRPRRRRPGRRRLRSPSIRSTGAPCTGGRGRTSTSSCAPGIASPASSAVTAALSARPRRRAGARYQRCGVFGRAGGERVAVPGELGDRLVGDVDLGEPRRAPARPSGARLRRPASGPSAYLRTRFAEHGAPLLDLLEPVRVGLDLLGVAAEIAAQVGRDRREVGEPAGQAVQFRVVAGLLVERAARGPEQAEHVGGVAGGVVDVAQQRVVRGARSGRAARRRAPAARRARSVRRPRPARARRPRSRRSRSAAGRSRGATRRAGRSRSGEGVGRGAPGRERAGVRAQRPARRTGRAPRAARPGRVSRIWSDWPCTASSRSASSPSTPTGVARPADVGAGPSGRADRAAQHQAGPVVEVTAGLDGRAAPPASRAPARGGRRRWPGRRRCGSGRRRPDRRTAAAAPVTTIVLPAPVSPVTTVRPGPSGSTASSITPSPRMCSSSSTAIRPRARRAARPRAGCAPAAGTCSPAGR